MKKMNKYFGFLLLILFQSLFLSCGKKNPHDRSLVALALQVQEIEEQQNTTLAFDHHWVSAQEQFKPILDALFLEAKNEESGTPSSLTDHEITQLQDRGIKVLQHLKNYIHGAHDFFNDKTTTVNRVRKAYLSVELINLLLIRSYLSQYTLTQQKMLTSGSSEAISLRNAFIQHLEDVVRQEYEIRYHLIGLSDFTEMSSVRDTIRKGYTESLEQLKLLDRYYKVVNEVYTKWKSEKKRADEITQLHSARQKIWQNEKLPPLPDDQSRSLGVLSEADFQVLLDDAKRQRNDLNAREKLAVNILTLNQEKSKDQLLALSAAELQSLYAEVSQQKRAIGPSMPIVEVISVSYKYLDSSGKQDAVKANSNLSDFFNKNFQSLSVEHLLELWRGLLERKVGTDFAPDVVIAASGEVYVKHRLQVANKSLENFTYDEFTAIIAYASERKVPDVVINKWASYFLEYFCEQLNRQQVIFIFSKIIQVKNEKSYSLSPIGMSIIPRWITAHALRLSPQELLELVSMQNYAVLNISESGAEILKYFNLRAANKNITLVDFEVLREGTKSISHKNALNDAWMAYRQGQSVPAQK